MTLFSATTSLEEFTNNRPLKPVYHRNLLTHHRLLTTSKANYAAANVYKWDLFTKHTIENQRRRKKTILNWRLTLGREGTLRGDSIIIIRSRSKIWNWMRNDCDLATSFPSADRFPCEPAGRRCNLERKGIGFRFPWTRRRSPLWNCVSQRSTPVEMRLLPDAPPIAWRRRCWSQLNRVINCYSRWYSRLITDSAGALPESSEMAGAFWRPSFTNWRRIIIQICSTVLLRRLANNRRSVSGFIYVFKFRFLSLDKFGRGKKSKEGIFHD